MYVLLMVTILNSVPIQFYPAQEQCLAEAIYWKQMFKREDYKCVPVVDMDDQTE